MKWRSFLRKIGLASEMEHTFVRPVLSNVSTLQLQQVYHLTTYGIRKGDNDVANPFLSDYPTFSTYVSKSSVDGAHNGVFLKGSAKKNWVVALYPGIFYPPMPLWTLPAADGSCTTTSLLRKEGNDYLMNLSGMGGFIDGNPIHLKHHLHLERSPYSCGNYINHPPGGCKPNVSTISFKWVDVYESSKEFHNECMLYEFLTNVVPNQFGEGPWYVDHDDNGVVYVEDIFKSDCISSLCKLKGVAFVAEVDLGSQGLNDTELFLNYKLEKKYRPDWYIEPTSE